MSTRATQLNSSLAVGRPQRWSRRVAVLCAAALASTFGLVGAGPAVVQAADPVETVQLGLASSFGAMTPNAAFTSTGGTTFRGDTGSTTYAFAAAGQHQGDSFIAPAFAAAYADLEAAYSDAEGRPAGTTIAGNISGLTFGPGVHTSVGAVGTTASTSFTIDGEGNSDAVFVFQVKAALALGASTKMILTGGAQAQNVFWQVNGAGGIGAGNMFVGTLMANGAVSSGEGTVVNGRLLTKTGAVAMANNNLFAGAPSVSITSPDSSLVSNPPISGVTSAVAPTKVRVTIDGVAQANQPLPDASGAWSLVLNGLLPNGVRTVVATVTDGAGNVGSFTQLLTITTSPAALSIDGGAVAATSDQTPTIFGTTDVAPGQLIDFTLTRKNTNAPHTNPPLVLRSSAFVQSDQTWNTTPNGMTGGEWTVVAAVTSAAGNTATDTQVLTVGKVFAITSSDLTGDSTPVITGTVTSGSTVKVAIGSGDGVTVTTTQNDTFWTATTTFELKDGTHPVTVTATNSAGISVLDQTLTVDLSGPTIGINPGANDSTSDSTPAIAGTTNASAGSNVSVQIDVQQPLTAVVQSDGSWKVTPSVALLPGIRTVVATVVDASGNTGTFTQSLTITGTAFVQVAPVALGLTEQFGALTPNAAFTSTGATTFRGDTGSTTYAFAAAGQHLGDKFIAPGFAAAYADLEAAYSDAEGRPAGTTMAGNISGLTFGPGVHTSVGAVGTTASTEFTIDGQGNSDAVFIFQVKAAMALGANTKMNLINGAQAQNVFWQVNGTGGIGTGNMFVGTLMANGAVSSGEASVINGRLLTKTGAIAMANNNLFSGAPTLSITGGAAIYSTVTQPAITGFTNVGAPATVTVTIDGVAQTNKPAPAAGGAWTMAPDAPLSDGEHPVVASVTDSGGNAGSFTQILTVDTKDPLVTIQSDTTSDQLPTITGTTDVVGQTVSIHFSQAEPAVKFVRTAPSQSDKTWNFTQRLLEGNWTIEAHVVDSAGRTAITTQSLSVSNEPNDDVLTGGPFTAYPPISGTDAAPGATVVVTIGDETLTTTVDENGNWTVTPVTPLGPGVYDVLVTITGLDGSVVVITRTVTVVALPTGGPTGDTFDTTPEISGSGAAPGATVVVTIGDETLTTTVAEDGTWEVTPVTPLSPGVYVATITITDADGNSVTTGQIITVLASSASGANLVGPIRVFDTRPGQSPDALRSVAKKQVSGGYELEVQMTELDSFTPTDGVGAVSMNVVSTGSGAAGYITTYDCGSRELVSSVNFSAGETVSNAVIAPVSADGTVCFYSSTPTDIVVDLNGWFAIGEAFTAVGPKRVFDTRPGQSPNSSRVVVKRQVSGGYELEVQMTALGSFVPANGVGAVSLNVTSTGSTSAGYITTYDCGARELVSSVNFPAGGTVGNAVIAPLSLRGTVCFYSSAPTDIVVDINGWFAAGEAFNTVGPKRVFDTRPGQSPESLRVVAKKQVSRAYELEVQMTELGRFTPADGMSAVSLNVTSVGSAAAGYITVYPCGTREFVASVNYPAGGIVGNAVIVPVSADGTVCFYSSTATDIVVDINGWFVA